MTDNSSRPNETAGSEYRRGYDRAMGEARRLLEGTLKGFIGDGSDPDRPLTERIAREVMIGVHGYMAAVAAFGEDPILKNIDELPPPV